MGFNQLKINQFLDTKCMAFLATHAEQALALFVGSGGRIN